MSIYPDRIDDAYLHTYYSVTATISSGTALSDAVTIGGLYIVAINMPASWDAASLTFQSSDISGTFGDLYTENGEVTLATVDAGLRIGVDKLDGMLGVANQLKIRSGTSGTPVNQSADRELEIILRAF